MIITHHLTGPKAEEEEKKADLSGASLESDSSAVMQETSDEAVTSVHSVHTIRQEGGWHLVMNSIKHHDNSTNLRSYKCLVLS